MWECAPYYARSYVEIAALFDTVYVSFYKGIGAIGGAMLAGSEALVSEARIWQRRHGGNLFTLFPYAAIAEQAFDDRIERMDDYRAAALRVADTLEEFHVSLVPSPPHTNMLHAFVTGKVDVINERVQRVARDHSIWTIGRLGATNVPDLHRWEISCGDATCALSDEQLHVALRGVLTG